MPKLALLILDGFGETIHGKYNAISLAKTPCLDALKKNHTHSFLATSGQSVGLPAGQIGNSEVGHMTIGAGRIISQDYTRLNQMIANGKFSQNKVVQQALNQNKIVHLLGLLSHGGVHSHEDHFYAILETASKLNVKKLYIHDFLDGRDTAPKCAIASIAKLETKIKKYQPLNADWQIVSLIGRYYAMDRDQHWDRIAKAYNLLFQAKADYYYENAVTAIQQVYQKNYSDEFIPAINLQQEVVIKEHDVVIFMNYRSDRARQLTQAIIEIDFQHFPRLNCPVNFFSLTQYNKNFTTPYILEKLQLQNVLAECLAKNSLRQLHLAETEKYAHVTFFFNGGKEKEFPLEDRYLIASPRDIKNYDEKPDMSAVAVTDKLLQSMQQENYDFIVCNYANADMVGHSGNLEATISAINCLDTCLARIIKIAKKHNYDLLITADHGNA